MRYLNKRGICTVTLLVSLLCWGPAAAEQIVVAANAQAAVDTLKRSEIKKVFTGKTRRWSNDKPVQIVLLAKGSAFQSAKRPATRSPSSNSNRTASNCPHVHASHQDSGTGSELLESFTFRFHRTASRSTGGRKSANRRSNTSRSSRA